MTEVTWGTEIALAIFFGGLGGGSFIVASAVDYFLENKFNNIVRSGSYVGIVAALLCILFFAIDAGHPERAMNLYSNLYSSMISFGTTVLSLVIILGLFHASFFTPNLPSINLDKLLPWRGKVTVKRVANALILILGFCLVGYTAFVLAAARIQAFWNSPLLVVLFFASGVSTALMAIALLLIIAYSLPQVLWIGPDAKSIGELLRRSKEEKVSSGQPESVREEALDLLEKADGYMLFFELIIALIYVYSMLCSPYVSARIATAALLYGPLSGLFVGVFLILGVVIPLLLILVTRSPKKPAFLVKAHVPIAALGAILVLIGGVAMRYAIVIAGQYPFLL